MFDLRFPVMEHLGHSPEPSHESPYYAPVYQPAPDHS